MILYSDAGTGKKFQYHIVTDPAGFILDYDVRVTLFWPNRSHIDPEIYGVLAAMRLTNKRKNNHHTVFTDSLCSVGFFLNTFSHKKYNLEMFKLYEEGQALIEKNNIRINHIPRDFNIAGKLIETHKFGSMKEAEEYFKLITNLRTQTTPQYKGVYRGC